MLSFLGCSCFIDDNNNSTSSVAVLLIEGLSRKLVHLLSALLFVVSSAIFRFDGDGVANYGGGSDEDGEENDESDSKLPPHEFIAQRLERSKISSFSILEGAGRTLKGRDLSKVRNAVLSKTGFLESL
ncbi:hypothetical protein D0Y65_038787 [Glycine soja]|uniref:Uncharacterized protein n=2 Tax=Glycine soja TaxID=3848 RepID=A0A445H7C9_GLYSO|nr:hypothetical protein D0Y65_038787 [Glycine soja]